LGQLHSTSSQRIVAAYNLDFVHYCREFSGDPDLHTNDRLERRFQWKVSTENAIKLYQTQERVAYQAQTTPPKVDLLSSNPLSDQEWFELNQFPVDQAGDSISDASRAVWKHRRSLQGLSPDQQASSNQKFLDSLRFCESNASRLLELPHARTPGGKIL
jgi:hypothetical protein